MPLSALIEAELHTINIGSSIDCVRRDSLLLNCQNWSLFYSYCPFLTVWPSGVIASLVCGESPPDAAEEVVPASKLAVPQNKSKRVGWSEFKVVERCSNSTGAHTTTDSSSACAWVHASPLYSHGRLYARFPCNGMIAKRQCLCPR